MEKKELLKKITEKKEFSRLPEQDVERAFKNFNKDKYTDKEKIKLTRALLLKVFSFSMSKRLLNIKDKKAEWWLRKHPSTRDRLFYYKKLYGRVLKNIDKKITVFDLGAGINGLGYEYFSETGVSVKYIGVEAIGQLADLMNYNFKKNKFNAKAIHMSLFELNKLKKIIKKEKKPKVVFLFKTIDSLELLERNYTKKLLLDLVPLVDKFILSFATKTLIKKERIWAKRKWIISFIKDNFNVLDDLEFNSERYICFSKK